MARTKQTARKPPKIDQWDENFVEYVSPFTKEEEAYLAERGRTGYGVPSKKTHPELWIKWMKQQGATIEPKHQYIVDKVNAAKTTPAPVRPKQTAIRSRVPVTFASPAKVTFSLILILRC